jgi:thiamine biosynthesis lipoprotein
VLNPETREITLLRPLVLDLGAVAKGMAMDLAARELQEFGSFSIDAGGDSIWEVAIQAENPGLWESVIHASMEK